MDKKKCLPFLLTKRRTDGRIGKIEQEIHKNVVAPRRYTYACDIRELRGALPPCMLNLCHACWTTIQSHLFSSWYYFVCSRENRNSSISVEGAKQPLWCSHCLLSSNELYVINRHTSTRVKWGKGSRRLMNRDTRGLVLKSQTGPILPLISTVINVYGLHFVPLCVSVVHYQPANKCPLFSATAITAGLHSCDAVFHVTHSHFHRLHFANHLIHVLHTQLSSVL